MWACCQWDCLFNGLIILKCAFGKTFGAWEMALVQNTHFGPQPVAILFFFIEMAAINRSPIGIEGVLFVVPKIQALIYRAP